MTSDTVPPHLDRYPHHKDAGSDNALRRNSLAVVGGSLPVPGDHFVDQAKVAAHVNLVTIKERLPGMPAVAARYTFRERKRVASVGLNDGRDLVS
jgi:hypothetical protein